MELKENLLKLDGFVISQTVNNKITSAALFGIEKKDDTHLGHGNITWAINGEVICNDCNMCDSCQGSCHSSCQGSCTSSCQGCVGCFGGCTSDCQGCTTTCTNACYGCNSCTECQTCVGENCNSCDGSCTSYVACAINVTRREDDGLLKCKIGCYMKCVSYAGPVDSTEGSTHNKQVDPIVVPPTVASVSCGCFGCASTVSGGPGCGNNYMYGGEDPVEVILSDGTKLNFNIKGEEVISGGGTKRTMSDLVDAILKALGDAYKMTDNTRLVNLDNNGNPIGLASYGEAKPQSGTVCTQGTSGPSVPSSQYTQTTQYGTTTISTTESGAVYICNGATSYPPTCAAWV